MTEGDRCCPTCGVDPDAVLRLEQANRDLELELRQKRAQITRLRGELIDKRVENPFAKPAQEVFEYWRELLAPRAKEFTDKRFDNVVARLRAGHSVEDLKRAVDGAAALPYVTDAGRRRMGKKSERQVELDLICRTEGHLMRFMSYAEDSEDEPRSEVPDERVDRYRANLTAGVQRRLHDLRGWEPEAMVRLGLGLDGCRVVFPVHDAEGRLVGLQRFAPNPDRRGGPKMLAEGQRDLFPRPESVTADRVWLVEGEPDAVAAASMGLAAVAVPGVATWKQDWAGRFERFEHVYIAFDCDRPGRDAAHQRQQALGKVTRATVVELDAGRDDGFDLGDLLLTHGPRAADVLRAKVKAVSSVMPFVRRTDPFEDFLGALEARDCRVRRQGRDKAQAACPVHDDRVPSMSVARGNDGRVLFHCFAGCDTGMVLGALGFEWRDLFEEGSG